MSTTMNRDLQTKRQTRCLDWDALADDDDEEEIGQQAQAELAAVYKYYENLANNHEHGEETAAGSTDNLTPEELSQNERFEFVTTDAHKIANQVFSKTKMMTPAKSMAFSDAYDTSQSYTRLWKLYNMSRADFYKQSTEDLAVRKSRLNYKRSLIISAIKNDAP